MLYFIENTSIDEGICIISKDINVGAAENLQAIVVFCNDSVIETIVRKEQV